MTKLRTKIKEKGITQRFIANKVNISETTFSKYVNGKRKPNYKLCEDIAKVLNCNPDDIFLS